MIDVALTTEFTIPAGDAPWPGRPDHQVDYRRRDRCGGRVLRARLRS